MTLYIQRKLFTNHCEIEELKKLLTLFESGSYLVSYEPEYRYEISDSQNWELAKNHVLFTTNRIVREELQEYYSDDKAYLSYLTQTYHGYNECFIFTQPTETLDSGRINYYSNLIEDGINPIAVIYSGYSQTEGIYEDGSKWRRTYESGSFILDGHHKLLAYKKLNRTPSLIRIQKIYESDNHLNFSEKDFEQDLSGYLLKCQVSHFMKNFTLGSGRR